MNTWRDDRNDSAPIERLLADLYAGPRPDPVFASALRDRLAARGAQLQVGDENKSAGLRRTSATTWRRWLAYGLGVLVVVLVAVNHQTVVAAAQRLLGYGYAPGVGFVDPSQTQVISGPTSQVHGKRMVTVTQAATSPQGTTIWLRLANPQDAAIESEPGGSLEGVWLEIAGGHLLKLNGFGASQDVLQMGLQFEPLPPGQSTATLVLPPDWRIPLRFVPAEQAGIPSAQVYPDTCTTASSVQVCVSAVVSDVQGTHILLDGKILASPYTFSGPVGLIAGNPLTGEDASLGTSLRDNQGRVLQRVWLSAPPLGFEVPPEGVQRTIESLDFERLPAGATSATLHLPALEATVPVGASFDVDLGPDPHVGDILDLAVTLEIDGQPVRFDRAQIVEDAHNGIGLRMTSLPIDVQEGRLVSLLYVSVSHGSSTPDSGQTIQVRGVDRSRQLVLWFDVADDQGKIIGGVWRVTVDSAQVTLLGPFELTWQIPPAP